MLLSLQLENCNIVFGLRTAALALEVSHLTCYTTGCCTLLQQHGATAMQVYRATYCKLLQASTVQKEVQHSSISALDLSLQVPLLYLEAGIRGTSVCHQVTCAYFGH